MSFAVPNIMIAAVAGLGLYAAYRLVKVKTEDVKPEGEGELALLGDPLNLQTNRYYRARLRVRDAGAPPFITSASRETITSAMQALGFSDVQVFMTPEELPSNWPASSKNNGGPNTRWFQAQWKQSSISLPRPPDIEQIWPTKPPTGAKYTVGGLPNQQIADIAMNAVPRLTIESRVYPSDPRNGPVG